MMNREPETISGLWAEVSGFAEPLKSKSSLEELFKNVVSWGISDLYLQVFREGRAWYNSSQFEKGCAWDPLETAQSLSKTHGVRLHAWVNALNLGKNYSSTLLSNLGFDSLITDDKGVRIDAYLDNDSPPDERGKFITLDAPKLWLDPAIPEVRNAIVTVTKEISTLYPEISGIHLDFIRYPYALPIRPGSGIPWGTDFGYGERAKFEFSKGGKEGALAWDNFRRKNIDTLIEQTKVSLGKSKSLSAAVITWPDRAYLSAYQNWRRWLLEEMVDQVCLMSYTADQEQFRYLCRQAVAFAKKGSKVIAGIGMYHFQDEKEIKEQIKIAKEEGTSGYIIFSYGNLMKYNWKL